MSRVGEDERGGAEADLAQRLEAARTAWPSVEVSAARFDAYVAERASAGEDLAKLHLSDLYLACACADGDPAAIAAFESAFFPACRDALASFAGGAGFADEVRQRVRTKLFVAEAGERSRIVEYAGRGELAGWLRVVVTREAIGLRRKHGREARLPDRAVGEAPTFDDPELLHLQRVYEAEFQRAFRDATRELTSEDRNLLRYHYLDGLNIDHIGAIYGIHRVTAARRLTKVRADLVLSTRRLLADRLRLTGRELESVLRLIESQVEISLGRVLSDGTGG